jgi:hypothetical protein
LSILNHTIYALPVLYLDPGSGSFIIQLLIAAALGIGVAARMYWAKIKSFITGKKSPPNHAPQDPDED